MCSSLSRYRSHINATCKWSRSQKRKRSSTVTLFIHVQLCTNSLSVCFLVCVMWKHTESYWVKFLIMSGCKACKRDSDVNSKTFYENWSIKHLVACCCFYIGPKIISVYFLSFRHNFTLCSHAIGNLRQLAITFAKFFLNSSDNIRLVRKSVIQKRGKHSSHLQAKCLYSGI